MKKHRGWIILALIVALAAAGIWLIGKVIAVYPGLGDPVSYPVNQVDGVTLTIEAPSFSPFQGYTIAWKVTADSDDVYHFTCDGEAPNIYAAVFIGCTVSKSGVPCVIGTLVGTIILAVLANGLTILQMPSFMQNIITGGIIILAVVLQKLGAGHGSR